MHIGTDLRPIGAVQWQREGWGHIAPGGIFAGTTKMEVEEKTNGEITNWLP